MKGLGGVAFHLLVALLCALTTATFSVSIRNQTVRCITAERRALLDFKKGLDDPGNILSSWTSKEAECCKWRGVGCDSKTGHVVMLDLRPGFTYDDVGFINSSVFLGGELGSSLSELKHLTHLDFSFNNFDRIPKFIGSLTELTYLNFSSNPLSGIIPYQLGNLSSLLYLDLTGYGMETAMTIDNLEWLSRLSSLKLLKIGGTDLTKAANWLQVIQSHPTLSILHFEDCGFAEVDPSSLSRLNSSNSLAVLHITFCFSFHPSTVPLLLNISRNLVDLDLSSNSLLCSIPDSFQNVPALERIAFNQNFLQGGIPKSLVHLCKLKDLDLWSNYLSEPLTVALKNLSGCAKDSLERLELGLNHLSGSLPSFVAFSSLRELYLDHNQLSGHFQDIFGKFSKLTILNMEGNRLTGPLPDLSRLASLKKLFLANNQFEGPFPVSIGKMSELVVLDVSSNSLNGVISEAHLFNLSNLLLLSFNSLSFNLSSDWIPPFQLDYIDISFCEVGPQFPGWLRRQTNFSHMDISHSKISDTIPHRFWNLPSKLLYLNLSFNNISGRVPNLPLKFGYRPLIDLSSNLFYGPIPQFFSNSTVLDLSNNMFSGGLSFLCTNKDNHLGYLDLSNNLLSGSIPDCWIKYRDLVVLNLENNNLSGIIPSSVGSLNVLCSLRLRNTGLHGELPQSLENCKELGLLDLGENKLTGIIPPWIGERLESLIVLRLRSNEFHGIIPSTLYRQQFLQILDLSLNNVSGTIPSCFNNLTAMAQVGSSLLTIPPRYFYVEGDYPEGDTSNVHTNDVYYDFHDHLSVMWKGVEQEYGNTLGLLKIIDLSSNKLSGEIPREVASLQGLITLNLSRNMLKGNIFKEIGQLKWLESLDLSTNSLSGEIPNSMANLSFLSVLDLSNNNLSGKIPTGTQLQSFNATSYSGNPGLCGAPLTKCPGNETAGSPNTGGGKSRTKRNEELFESLWFYTGMMAGFVVGFWGVFGTILINKSWRYKYFRFLTKIGDWIRLTMALNMAKLQRRLRLKV